MSNQTKTVALADATPEQLKNHAITVMGLELNHMIKKPETIIAKMLAVEEDLTEIEVPIDDGATENEDTRPVAPESVDAGEWTRMIGPDGKPVDLEFNNVTRETRPLAYKIDAKLDPEEFMWVTISHETNIGTAKSRSVFLSINTKSILVPRGVKAPLKRKYIGVLEDAIMTSYSYDDNGDMISEDSPIVPYSVHGTVKDLGVNYGGKKGLQFLNDAGYFKKTK